MTETKAYSHIPIPIDVTGTCRSTDVIHRCFASEQVRAWKSSCSLCALQTSLESQIRAPADQAGEMEPAITRSQRLHVLT